MLDAFLERPMKWIQAAAILAMMILASKWINRGK